MKGSLTPGEEVFLRVDQTLTHDINAVMTYLAFEAIGLPRVRTECSVSYLDHNLLYIDHKTPDDHIYLQSAARKCGVWVSRPGNGICHAVHAARFGVPGKICMGGDSHTPHGGAIGMLCIGVGGMDVATAMTGVPMRLKMPKVVNIRLTGSLRPGVNAKEVILELLRRVSIKGGLGKVYEYTGPGVETLEVPQRATIANMGAEMGATGSIFPADAQVKKFLTAQHRADAYTELLPDPDAVYDEVIELDLSALEPLAACPHQPDNVKPLRLVEKQPVQQVFIGSCTNTSYADVARAALVFRGHHVNENVSCTCGIASRQTYRELMRDGYIDMLLPPLPSEEAARVELVRGPNIQPLPVPEAPADHLEAPVSLKAGDNVSTDDITPASAEFSSMRSNIPLMSRYCYHRYDPGFAERAKAMGKSIIVGGENYGQGSSREHAAINPMYLGVKCVLAKSIARIHKGNLVNHGIVPMLFADPADYDRIGQEDVLEIKDFRAQIAARRVTVRDKTRGFAFEAVLDLTDSEVQVVLCGGQLRYLKQQLAKEITEN